MDLTIRLATHEDAAGLAAIYDPIVRDTMISAEIEPPGPAGMALRVEATRLERLPWLVCANGAAILGYAYARPYRARAAYQWSLETSVYVASDARGRGVGRALYTTLFALVTSQGYRRAIAGIGLPNEPSVRLHEALGFAPVGVYPSVCYKHGAWQDVGFWQLSLGPAASQPAPPGPVPPLTAEAWQSAVAAGLAQLTPT